MEGVVPISESGAESPTKCTLLILHTAEAQEWAKYLQMILNSSTELCKRSILLYTVGLADQLHEYNFECFHSIKCVVLLLTAAFLDILHDVQLCEALQRLLHPPHKVVVLLCGLSEDDVLPGNFEHWPSWRKLHAEDEPALYISTVLECITYSKQEEAEQQSAASDYAESQIAPASLAGNQISGETEEEKPVGEKDTGWEDVENVTPETSTSEEIITCLTVQPTRVLCGDRVTIFIILTRKLDKQLNLEVDFFSENITPTRVTGTFENEYTVSVTAPDLPAGVVSLVLYTDQSPVCLRPITYYTNMGEVSRHLENATDPMEFISQAFNITANITESLDDILTASLQSRMPADKLNLFGNRQIEEDNMSAYQRTEELPTVLHFSAKYGLKKLTKVLLKCPGALQAYSVMNKDGDYPNTLAEKSGFSDLRQFMDDFVETVDILKSQMSDSIATEEDGEVYEFMSTVNTEDVIATEEDGEVYEFMSTVNTEDVIAKYSSGTEDIYESMLGIDPDCIEDLYEVMNAAEECQNPEEAMLRKFFQPTPGSSQAQDEENKVISEEEAKGEQDDLERYEEEEDPYNLFPEDVYYAVDEKAIYRPDVWNRPPAPVPRPEASEHKQPQTYISRDFYTTQDYAEMTTPGQKQLIALQDRVKIGKISVDEAVLEFRAWKLDHEQRSSSIRYQQQNLQRLRESITRRHKEREKIGKELDYEITAPLQSDWGCAVSLECAVYESSPQLVAPAPPYTCTIKRGNWKTGSNSSSSSIESNRLSTHSTISYSSGTEPDFEDTADIIPRRQQPPRPSDAAPVIPPPRIPPRVPGRVPENTLDDRYISYPTRALPQIPSHRGTSLPPIPRRTR
ncbi:phosphoinositide 3-kinase adapter protein 1 isoform X2 [Lampris incognitus]|uniref:phosphoinositide 3-kinase adapter protein 1 isoform X2 n=1 Tax=Lampris incognitus TaxID=2546036 RepID=UPI0024B4E434|nr:phosphoinositide 3-kinase adapter protein 1 isoform X2 [Lampris incognitus]